MKASPLKGMVAGRERRESKTHDEGIKMNITLVEQGRASMSSTTDSTSPGSVQS